MSADVFITLVLIICLTQHSSSLYLANLDWDPSRLSPYLSFPSPPLLSASHQPLCRKKGEGRGKKPSCLWLSCPPAYEALFYFDHRSTMDSCHSGNFIQYQPKFTYCLTSLCVTVDASDQSAFGNLSHLNFFFPLLPFISNACCRQASLTQGQRKVTLVLHKPKCHPTRRAHVPGIKIM